jgi:hypothetical protein
LFGGLVFFYMRLLSGGVDPASLPGAVRVEPEDHLVARFDAVAQDEHQAARERGEKP